MKRSIVPAQITTVEDQIVGGLSPQQLALLIFPFCLGFVAFAVMPPNFHLASYKIGIVVFLEVIGAALSIRVKEKMLLHWIITVVRYNVRPRYYVYDKNDSYLRDEIPSGVKHADMPEQQIAVENSVVQQSKLKLADVVKLEEIMADPRANLRFKTGKDGKLNVVIQEIK